VREISIYGFGYFSPVYYRTFASFRSTDPKTTHKYILVIFCNSSNPSNLIIGDIAGSQNLLRDLVAIIPDHQVSLKILIHIFFGAFQILGIRIILPFGTKVQNDSFFGLC